MKIDNFFAELKRRNVYKVAVAYIVGGWALSQGIAQVLPVFDVPNWVVRLLVLLIVIGFPVALFLAWAFELTPEGIKRTEDVDSAVPLGARSHAWIYVVAVGALLSIGLFFLGRYTAPKAGIASKLPAKSIAVLPFENLSEEKANAYFAEGVQNEILTKLTNVRDLKVISRTSTAKYQSKPDNLKAVAQELGVSNILEGTVRLRPDSAEAHFARADYLFRCLRDYDRALEELAIARPGLPNSSPFYSFGLYQSPPQSFSRSRTGFFHCVRDRSTQSECLQSYR